jgi:hypothetical protein
MIFSIAFLNAPKMKKRRMVMKRIKTNVIIERKEIEKIV